MKPTKEMIEAFCAAAGMARIGWPSVHSGLEAALAPYAAPPFVLSDDENKSYGRVASDDYASARENALLQIIDRAIKTLGVAQAAPAAGEWSQDDYDAACNAFFATKKSGGEWTDHPTHAVHNALNAVKHRVATQAAPVASLSTHYRAVVERMRSAHAIYPNTLYSELLGFFDERFPRPAVKTNEELAKATLDTSLQWDDRRDAANELVRRANGAK